MYNFSTGTEEVQQGGGGSFGKFGLNPKATLVSFEFRDKTPTGKDMEHLYISFKIGEGEYNKMIFPLNLDDNPYIKTDEDKEKMSKVFNDQIGDILVCFQEEEKVKAYFSKVKINSFKEFITHCEKIVKANKSWNTIELDLFLQWQKKIQEGKDKNYLEIPFYQGKSFHGKWCVKHINGDFKEDRTDKHLRYVDDKGVIHPFRRGEWWIKESGNQNQLSVSKPNEPIQVNISDLESDDSGDGFPF